MTHDRLMIKPITLRNALIAAGIGSVVLFAIIVIVRVWSPWEVAAAAGNEQGAGENQSELDASGSASNADGDVEEQHLPRVAVSELERARAKAALAGFQAKAQEATKWHQALVSELQAYQTVIDSLLTSEDGRRFASTDRNVDVYLGITQKERPDSSKINAWKTQIETLVTAVESAESKSPDVTILLPDDYATELQSIVAEIRAPLQELQQDLSVLNAIVAASSSQPASAPTLQDTIAERRAKEAQEAADRIAAARRQAKEESISELEAAEREKVEAENEIALTRIQAEKDRLAREAEAASRSAAAEEKAFMEAQAKLQLEREFNAEREQVLSMLTPFVYKHDSQLNTRGTYSSTVEPTAVSLSAIEGLGGLEQSVAGLHQLHKLGNYGSNGRPLGGFPIRKSNSFNYVEGAKDRVMKAQEYLIKYGDLLVEKGHLAR